MPSESAFPARTETGRQLTEELRRDDTNETLLGAYADFWDECAGRETPRARLIRLLKDGCLNNLSTFYSNYVPTVNELTEAVKDEVRAHLGFYAPVVKDDFEVHLARGVPVRITIPWRVWLLCGDTLLDHEPIWNVVPVMPAGNIEFGRSVHRRGAATHISETIETISRVDNATYLSRWPLVRFVGMTDWCSMGQSDRSFANTCAFGFYDRPPARYQSIADRILRPRWPRVREWEVLWTP